VYPRRKLDQTGENIPWTEESGRFSVSEMGLVTSVISVRCRHSPIMAIVKSPAKDTLSRWVCQGLPPIIGVGVVAAFLLRLSLALPLSKLAVPIAALLGIQVVFYVAMYAVRKRYSRTRDLRTPAFVAGIYGLCIVLAGMYYAGQLGIASARTFEDNYIEFSVFMGVVTCIVVGIFSFVKPAPHSSS
jgi:hypothetical protein